MKDPSPLAYYAPTPNASRFSAWSVVALSIQPLIICLMAFIFPAAKTNISAPPPPHFVPWVILQAVLVCSPTIIAVCMAIREIKYKADRQLKNFAISCMTLAMGVIVLILFGWALYHDLTT